MLEVVRAILTEEAMEDDMLKLKTVHFYTIILFCFSWVALLADEMIGGYAWLCCVAIHVICTATC